MGEKYIQILSSLEDLSHIFFFTRYRDMFSRYEELFIPRVSDREEASAPCRSYVTAFQKRVLVKKKAVHMAAQTKVSTPSDMTGECHLFSQHCSTQEP